MAVASTKDLLTDLSPLIQVYTDGTVHRLISSPHVPPSPEDPATSVASKDILIPPSNIPARLYLPKLSAAPQKLPILLYHHGGGFCLESAFSFLHHRYANLLSAASPALILSLEYRLAPEHPLPAAYHDSSFALRWLCSHALDDPTFEKDPWIADHADLGRIFIAGDGSGANIAHNVVMRAGSEPLPGNVKVNGAILCHPFFCGEDDLERGLGYRLWSFVYSSAGGGIDNPAINPVADGAPSLSGLGCSRMIVCLAEKDPAAARGKVYAEMVRRSGWRGEVETAEYEGEGHCFQISDTHSQNAKNFIDRLVAFISRCS
ncbi:2-hydroxyisoflavanone dehydratase-like [Salvia hispanica]|uniref:2-hydroxyisoflavanone dehydratase-like n=1 Tax=Salvia hispanica TaxID=49212 RepID=UPI002009BE29|nr:2-hydroxyisoflavanone dehydratase-like [Salvia hispanica]